MDLDSIDTANKYIDQTAPFKLAKDPAQANRLDEVLYNLAEACRVLAVLLWPFLPGMAEKIHGHLVLPKARTSLAKRRAGLPKATPLARSSRCFRARRSDLSEQRNGKRRRLSRLKFPWKGYCNH